MGKSGWIFAILVVGLIGYGFWADASAKLEQENDFEYIHTSYIKLDGFYSPSNTMVYVRDKSTGLCFAYTDNRTLACVPCDSLHKRNGLND